MGDKKKAQELIGDARWKLIMDSVDSGTLDAQKMHDVAFGLGTTVGGRHTQRLGGVERMKADRAEMGRIFGDWCQLNDDLTSHKVAQKLIDLFKNDDIQLNLLANR